jgi:hypothetical protein
MLQPDRSSAAPRAGLLSVTAAALLAAASIAGADEIVVQNDSVEDGDSVAIQVGFIAQESAAAWLTSPCDGTIVAVQVFWQSFFGNEPPSLEEAITIYESGSYPSPGAILEVLPGPVMTDGKLNEFRFLDKNQQIPLQVPVSEGQTFVVAFTFANDPPPLGPSIVTDIDGCQTPKNSLFAVPQGWLNPCLLGISGDFFIRAVIDCGDVLGACCFTNGACFEDLTSTECEDSNGVYQGDGTTCADVECVTTEACCFQKAGCLDFPRDICIEAGGFPQGSGTNCAETECFPVGACCLADGGCLDDATPEECDAEGGVFQGDGTACGGVECPVPDGACCFATDFCLVLKEADCLKAGATWIGPDTDCADNNGNETADVCEDCPEDLNDDQMVGFDDLLLVLEAWGPCEGCPADLNGDDAVDFDDLLRVLAAWGDC